MSLSSNVYGNRLPTLSALSISTLGEDHLSIIATDCIRYVQQDESAIIDLKPLSTAEYSKLYLLLLQGEVELRYGNHSIVWNGSFDHCLGSFFVPPSIRALMKDTSSKPTKSSGQRDNDSSESFCYASYFEKINSNGQTISPNRSTLFVGKGCHYIYLCSIECGHYLKTVFD